MSFFFFLFLSLLLSTFAEKCPLYAIYSSQFKSCLIIPNQQLTWSTSQSYCKYLGGDLTVIDNASKNTEFIQISTNMVNGISLAFIGAYTENRVFKWVDGTSFAYNNFSVPTSAKADSVVVVEVSNYGMGSKGSWDQLENTEVLQFSCSVPVCSSQFRPTLNPRATYSGFFYSTNFDLWYMASPDRMDNSDADNRCKSLGGSLPTVINAFQNMDVMNIMRQANTADPITVGHNLLGASSDASGKWTWSNGDPVNYTNWAPNEPFFPTGSEARMDYKTGLWYSMMSTMSSYLCVLPAVPNAC